MMKGLISVLVPNYNNARYLAERFNCILAQTFNRFEVVVCDSYSTDCAWEIIQSYAGRDTRIQAVQVPKEGIYAGWNECIKRATGEFIYIATSDDTMAPDCLEKLTNVLRSNPDCGVAMCGLDLIDEAGRSLGRSQNWGSFPSPIFFADIFKKPHIRCAPLDGVLAGTLHCIWHSATQLLIRRDVFKRHGLYRTDMGSIADFEWNTRVALFENVAYIPDLLATLRVHSSSASSLRGGYTSADMTSKIRVLETVADYAKPRSAALHVLLEKSGWTQAFRFQRWVYLVKEKPVSAFLKGFRALMTSPLNTLSIVLTVVCFAAAGKESLRAAFTRKLLKKTGLRLLDSIRYHE